MSDAMTSLCQAGITLSVAGDTLVARPRAAITDELRDLIRDNKGALMVELAEQARGAEDPGPSIDACMARLSERDLTQRQVSTEVEVPGVSSEFQARLDAEDRADIAAGGIPVEQVVAFEAAAIAREARALKVILEHDASLPRADAELEAACLVVAYARNNGYLWASLRAALADSPVLVPDRPGRVDTLSLGLARLAVLKDKRVVRQGEFSGAQEVTP